MPLSGECAQASSHPASRAPAQDVFKYQYHKVCILAVQWHTETALVMKPLNAVLSSCFKSHSWYADAELNCDNTGQTSGAEYEQKTRAPVKMSIRTNRMGFSFLFPTSHYPQNTNNLTEDLVLHKLLSVWTLISEDQY